MTIRSEALRWLSSNHGDVKSKIYTSKYYLPHESWPKTHVWWPQIPISAIDEKLGYYINLVCQADANSNKFHYLKVPITFFEENLDKFDKVNGKIHLYLSADPNNLFVEQRGIGKINFTEFLVS